jgi:hypothetical protein
MLAAVPVVAVACVLLAVLMPELVAGLGLLRGHDATVTPPAHRPHL